MILLPLMLHPLILAADLDRSVVPEPLEAPAFVLPTPTRGLLSNGVEVVLVENHELPLFELRVVFKTGGWTDPEGLEGLTGATLDMLNEGAGTYDAVTLSAETRELGSGLWTNAGLDLATVGCSGLVRNMEPTLDLWSTVLLQPTFPSAEWDRLEVNYAQGLEEDASDPTAIAWKVSDRVLYGDRYDGRSMTLDSLGRIDPEGMQAWYQEHLVPGNALILVGGDVTLDQVLPLLEARLGTWTAEGSHEPPRREAVVPTETTLYVVDKPGASQSVVIAATPVPGRLDASWYPLYLGNRAWGGSFMARLNMTLREEKGWTYGARSFVSANDVPGVWVASSSVVAEATAPAVNELLVMLGAVAGDQPLTEDEIEYARSGLLNGYAARFETVDYLLDQQKDIWRYGLPSDWSAAWPGQIDQVSPEDAQTVFQEQVAERPMAIVVVGDMATNLEALVALGPPVVHLDIDGNPVVTMEGN